MLKRCYPETEFKIRSFSETENKRNNTMAYQDRETRIVEKPAGTGAGWFTLKDACGFTNPKQATHEEISAIFEAAM